MFDLTLKNLARIQEHKIHSLDGAPIGILPFYHGLNLANIPASICRWFQIPALQDSALDLPDPPISLDSIKNIMLLVIDGLAFEQMQNWLEKGIQKKRSTPCWQNIREMGIFSPLTSVVPSTTANALTSLWTGKMPAEHGVIGYELFLKEFGITVNMILQTQVHPVPANESESIPWDLSKFLPVPQFGAHLKKFGIHPFAFQHEMICGSGLSRMLLPEVEKIPFTTPQDMLQKVNDLLECQHASRKYLYLYWSDIDTLSHHYGPNSRKTRHAWQWFAHVLENFLCERSRRSTYDTLFLVTSDHGQIPTHIRPVYEVRNDQEFMSHLEIPPSGESRLPYLFIKAGMEKSFREYVEQRWRGEFSLIPAQQLMKWGVFGKEIMTPDIQNRLGNFVALPTGNAYWWWAHKENQLLGRHGGFSPQEMITPLLILPA